MAIEPISRLSAPRGAVHVENDWIEGALRINDPEGATFLRSKDDDDRVDACETALRVGLRALAAADHTFTERLLDEKLDALTGQLVQAADATLRRVSDAFEERWRKHIDDDLARRLDEHRTALDERLSALFADGSDKSVQQMVRRFLAEYQVMITREIGQDRVRLRTELGELINGTANPDHPLAKLNTQLGNIRTDIAATLAAAQAAAAGHELRQTTGSAGLTYQAQVYAVLVQLLQGSDDEPELKGRSPGATGGAEGDIVITVDPALTSGKPARVAVEVTKQETGVSLAKVKASMKKALEDRDAQVAVLVVRNPAIAGGQRLQFINGLGVVAVYEPEDPDDVRALALLVAVKHARAVAVRTIAPDATQRDEDQIKSATTRLKGAMVAVTEILGNQSKIRKAADATSLAARQLPAMDAFGGRRQ